MNTLAKELGLSRSSLYAKFKALTGMTPNDFVLNCKLKRAATLLITRQDLPDCRDLRHAGFWFPPLFHPLLQSTVRYDTGGIQEKEGRLMPASTIIFSSDNNEPSRPSSRPEDLPGLTRTDPGATQLHID